MAILLVLLILVLGYRYTNAIPAEKIALKRSSGWEAYVRMGSHGIGFVWNAICVYAILAACSIVSIFSVAIIFHIFGNDSYSDFLEYMEILWSLKIHGIGINEVIVTLFSFASCSASIREENNKSPEDQRKEIRKQDAVLNIIIDAAEQLHPVKISLKSRKIYIGIIQAEQFERPDLDNIAMIPFYSGHRDKDTLNIIFDSNYIKVYEKHYGKTFSNHSIKSLSPENIRKLEEFRIVIRLSEIESISFFDLTYYFDDFAEKPRNRWQTASQWIE